MKNTSKYLGQNCKRYIERREVCRERGMPGKRGERCAGKEKIEVRREREERGGPGKRGER